VFADWSAFDVVGVNAYFPLEAGDSADAGALARAWRPHLSTLGAIAEKMQKKVVFTEAGVAPVAGAHRTPWDGGVDGEADPERPAVYIDALLRAALPQPWFRGVCWWKWFTDDPTRGPGGERDAFRLAGTSGERMLRQWMSTRG